MLQVSYAEDVEQDDDDEYNEDEEEEEDEEDHVINLTSPRKTHSRSNSRSPGSGGQIGKQMTPGSATKSYAQALQNLLPGVDLSCLQSSGNASSASKTITLPAPATKIPVNNTPATLQGQYIKGLFECGICGAFFSTAGQFVAHQNTAHPSTKKQGQLAMETFRCEICSFVLTNRFAYLEHKKTKHNKSMTFSCSKCRMSFGVLNDLQKHQATCGMPSCMTCHATFKSWVEVAEHRMKHHGADVSANTFGTNSKWLHCKFDKCMFKAQTAKELQFHFKNTHEKDVFKCNAPGCIKVYMTRELLTEHKRQVHASEFIVQYQCIECKNCFSTKTILAEHQYLHSMEKLRKCDLCLRSFMSFNDLRRHRDVHVTKGQFRCQGCKRWCESKNDLINHYCPTFKKVSNLRIYFCDVCQKDFRSDEKMFEHRREHKNFYQCGICFNEYNTEQEFVDHRETHGKFTCLLCFDEMDQEKLTTHQEAHNYYVKMEDLIEEGKNEKRMYLYPNLLSILH